MLSKLKLVTVLVALSLSSPVLADGGGGTNVGVDVSAGASAAVNQTNKGIGAASIGAANCAGGVVLGPVGVTGMNKTCQARTAADYWAARGNTKLADEVMMKNDPMTKAAVKSLEEKAKKSGGATASTKAADDGMRDTFWLDGTQYRLTTKSQIAAFNACRSVHVPQLGVHVKMNGC